MLLDFVRDSVSCLNVILNTSQLTDGSNTAINWEGEPSLKWNAFFKNNFAYDKTEINTVQFK